MSAPVGKRGEPEYIEKQEAAKRGRKGVESPKTREREAKTKAAYAISQQLSKEEQATRQDRPFARKRVKPEPGTQTQDTQEIGKMRKGKKGQPVEAQAPEEGKASFSELPRGVIQQVLGHLPAKKDLQATRQVEQFMNQEVVRRVKGYDLPHIRILTELLIDELPELRHGLRIPRELIAALESSNLEEYTEALYSVRSRLIDVLASLEPEKIDELERAFNEKGMPLPTKFQNFFQLVRIHQNEDEAQQLNDLSGLNETYEYYRVCAKSGSEATRILAVSRSLQDIFMPEEGDNPPLPEEGDNPPFLHDSATFKLIEREYSRDDTLENNCIVHIAHISEGMTRIANGLFDKGIESFEKAVEYFGKIEDKKGKTGEALFGGIIQAIVSSEIDPKSAEKLFQLLEQAVKRYAHKNKTETLLGVYGYRLKVFAYKGFAELQIALNRTIQLLDTITDVEAKHEAVEALVEDLNFMWEIPKAEQKTVKMRLVNALLAATNSNTKTELFQTFCAEKLAREAKKDSPELQNTMNQSLRFLESFSDVSAKREAVQCSAIALDSAIKELYVKAERYEQINTRLFDALQAAEESDSKYATLSLFYATLPEHVPDNIQADADKKALAMLDRIQDPRFKEEMRMLIQ